MTPPLTYEDAGVDVRAVEQSQDRMGKIISGTHKSQKHIKVRHGFGHYAGIVETREGTVLATHTDGVGTKVMIANMMKKYDTVGIDCVAMNVNDIICTGATPVSFVDYIAANQNDEAKFTDIMEGLALGARKGEVPIVGGETAIMPDLFNNPDFAFDLAGTVVGLIPVEIDPKAILGGNIDVGDVIVGAYSSGLHSNGYTLARKALQEYPLEDKLYRGGPTIGSALLEPTEIYVKPVLDLLSNFCPLRGLAHITGGSFTKLLRLKNIGFEIDDLPPMPKIMSLIMEQGVALDEMYKTFNMGIGFCVVVPEKAQDDVIRTFSRHDIRSKRIGCIVPEAGVVVGSTRITSS